MKFDSTILSDFEQAKSLEWIETNGLGGYASGTASGALSRRYHGLLVAALHPPVGRTVLLHKLDETVVVKNESAEARYELSSNQYPGVIHPKGYSFLTRFERDIFPEFYYNAGGVNLKKTIACIQGENTTVLLYEVLEAPGLFTLELLPLCSSRDFHSLTHANDVIGRHYLFDEGTFQTVNYPDGTELFISVPGSEFKERQGWYYRFEYSVEQYRGLDFREDLYTHGNFSITLKRGDRLGVIISTDNPVGRNALKVLATERKRRENIIRNFSFDTNIRRLVLAADQFIVQRGKLSTVIAGYHWFADWGRDTMISLPGLCLSVGRVRESKQIIKQFLESASQGMLPNRFPDYGELPEYNTLDATLWLFHAIYEYYEHTHDKPFVKSIIPLLREIIDWHYKGTRYNIKVDPDDELLSGGAEGVQLTWMDAKVGNWIVTPRRGKPVEINALWYNALHCMEVFSTALGASVDADMYKTKAEKVLNSFNEKFWNEKQKSLYDYIDGSIRNEDLRPNQVFALSLPFPLLSGDRAKKVLQCITENLLTPRGLRSLAGSHKEYRPAYGGDVWMRDGCYHQGTVWSYLLGPYVDALFYVKGEKARSEAVSLVKRFLEHLDEAGIGTVSEIFDGDPPHTPRGCISQAWSVGEALRVILKYNLLQGNGHRKSDKD